MRIARMILALMLVFVAVAVVPAQTPPSVSAGAAGQVAGQRAGGPPPQTPAPGRGGRGRGRVTVQIMTLTAPWPAGGEIPLRYTQAGEEISPALSWANVPETAASFVLIVHDVSATAAQGSDDVLHWLVWNIPGAARELPEGVPQGPQRADGTRQISTSGPYYRGPAAASGPAHFYLFELYALDAMIAVPAVGAQGVTVAQTRAAVVEAMAGHIRGKAVTVGQFRRQ